MGEVISIESSRSAKALKERDRFLRKHPELKPLQRDVDDMLKKAGSTHNRLVMIRNLMMDSFMDLNDKLQSMAGNH